MPFRRRRPIARAATTAVVAGTAASMGARSAQRTPQPTRPRQTRLRLLQRMNPPSQAAAPQADVNARIEQVKQLAALKNQDILTEEEFLPPRRRQILDSDPTAGG